VFVGYCAGIYADRKDTDYAFGAINIIWKAGAFLLALTKAKPSPNTDYTSYSEQGTIKIKRKINFKIRYACECT